MKARQWQFSRLLAIGCNYTTISVVPKVQSPFVGNCLTQNSREAFSATIGGGHRQIRSLAHRIMSE
jgi:hypothetical protein